jgi:cation diffusion facilitator CzcD-associated flavoprotein CzcO
MIEVDVVIVGAGFGGLYSIERLRRLGLSILCIEAAAGVGGVWLHNRYPGARVDIESLDYCYHFSPELFAEWHWSERFAAQEELLRYLDHVADRFDLRRFIRFNAGVERAHWRPGSKRYEVGTSDGDLVACRFLLLATGNLSAARPPDFPGLESFEGEWVQTSNWPDQEIEIAGRRVAVIGTGSSGVQVVTSLAAVASQLTVFQRTANFSVPARNVALEPSAIKAAAATPGRRESLLASRIGSSIGLPGPVLKFAEYSEAERSDRLERQWAAGGQGMNCVFADQAIDPAVNRRVADFVRDRIRETVTDAETAALLCPTDHPIGTRRLCMDIGYYESFNRPNVRLVDVAADPIERITPTGICLRSGTQHEVDLIVLALGFRAFRGAIDDIDIRNGDGARPSDSWDEGPRTLVGLMTHGFPNFFFLTGPGSPSVLANMALMNEQHVDFVAGLIAHMLEQGHITVEPEADAQEDWTAHVADAASGLLRLNVDNYMVHVSANGNRVFMPYVGGLDRFDAACRRIAAEGYRGFSFDGESIAASRPLRQEAGE